MMGVLKFYTKKCSKKREFCHLLLAKTPTCFYYDFVSFVFLCNVFCTKNTEHQKQRRHLQNKDFILVGEGESMQEKPLVSIFMATYNHVSYIREALDSCLIQETDFPFEIIVCDDCSTDGTREIVKEYAHKHKNIVLSLQDKNTKTSKNLLEGLKRIQGKYVAFCEGDDFWTDTKKLQKQVGFLEENPDFSVACHKVHVLDAKAEKISHEKQYIYKDIAFDEERIKEGIFYADEAISNYFFQTSSVVFRWRFTEGLPDWFTLNMLLDHFLFMLHAVLGKIKYFDEDMSVWRRHEGGYSWLQTINKGLFAQKKYEDWIYVYEEMDRFFSYRFTLQIRERNLLILRNLLSHYMHTNQIEQIKVLYNKYKKYFEKPILENADMIDGLRIAYPDERRFYPPWQSKSLRGEKSHENREERLAIGGYFELDIKSVPLVANSVWDMWVADKEYAYFNNNLQALTAYLWQQGCKDIWLPAYFPYFTSNIVKPLRLMPKFYPLDAQLKASSNFLNEVRPGEAVLTFSHFGKPIDAELEAALFARKDILWIDDKSQALCMNLPSRANVCLYSPSNLFGVPDGALLVGEAVSLLQPKIKATQSDAYFEMLKLSLKRMENPSVTIQDILAYSKAINEDELPQNAGSELTIEMLKRLPIQPMAKKRMENWLYLSKHLKEYAFWKDESIDFAPFAYPLRIPYNKSQVLPKDALLTLLANHAIFCPPVGHVKADFMQACLSDTLLLPCDQRYDEKDMDKIIHLVRKYMDGKIEKNELVAW